MNGARVARGEIRTEVHLQPARLGVIAQVLQDVLLPSLDDKHVVDGDDVDTLDALGSKVGSGLDVRGDLGGAGGGEAGLLVILSGVDAQRLGAKVVCCVQHVAYWHPWAERTCRDCRPSHSTIEPGACFAPWGSPFPASQPGLLLLPFFRTHLWLLDARVPGRQSVMTYCSDARPEAPEREWHALAAPRIWFPASTCLIRPIDPFLVGHFRLSLSSFDLRSPPQVASRVIPTPLPCHPSYTYRPPSSVSPLSSNMPPVRQKRLASTHARHR